MGVEIVNREGGDGKTFPTVGKKVKCHYIGKLESGTVFDSSYDRREPIEFIIGIGQVIKGWDEGIQKLSKGEKATLICSADYGYGNIEVGEGMIPKNSTLIVDVELLSF